MNSIFVLFCFVFSTFSSDSNTHSSQKDYKIQQNNNFSKRVPKYRNTSSQKQHKMTLKPSA